MNVCFPVKEVSALESEVYGHFGSAPSFVLVDSETENLTVLGNSDQHHAHGMCNPIMALGGQSVDCVVVGGIGGGALMKLNSSGVRVYKAMARTVRENLGLLRSGHLPEFRPGHTCGGHGSECSH